MLELRNVSRSYRGIPAIKDISFRVETGEVVGYLGPNGSGKSTTVKIIAGLLQPNDGQVFFEGRNILRLLDLDSWRHSPISSYSKGMKQRVLIAAALMHDPKLFVFDEPLSGLDVVSARLFKDLLQELARQGKTILYISHVLEVVEQVCDRVIVIARGKILANAAPAELTKLMELGNLESVFAQLVRQKDTKESARQLVEVMRNV
jgi:ABC-2 type transport system ATP-binding protein